MLPAAGIPLASWETAASRVFHAVRLDPIRRKILVFALVATLIPSLSLGWRSYVLNRDFITGKLTEDLKEATDGTARETALWLKERLYEVRVFGSSYEVTENLEQLSRTAGAAGAAGGGEPRRRLTEYLRSVQGKFQHYDELMVLDTAGRALASSTEPAGPPLGPEMLRGARPDAPLIGSITWDAARRKVVLPVAAPLTTAAGRSVGFLAGRVNLGAVEEVLRSHVPGQTGQAYLTTADGRVVARSRPGEAGGALMQVAAAAGGPLRDHPETLVEYGDERGRPVLGVLKAVPVLGWSAVAEITQAEAYEQIARTRTLTLATVAALLVGIGLTAYVVGLTVVRPLERLTRAATRVAAGDLEVALRVVDHGEGGYLTEVFNNMVERLRQGRDQLAAANVALSDKNEELEKLSTTDGLTGLNNRRHLNEALANEVARARRLGHRFAILMIDIDHFKEYNDSHGHQAGDRLLTRLGALFRDVIRSIDYAARYGGEEFLILLYEAGPTDGATVAERLRERVAVGEPPEPPVTISVGVAAFPVHGDTGEEIIHHADTALYEAKRRGRNQVVIAPASR
jgi:diguanylate cyclase (GGDEF)-like protein